MIEVTHLSKYYGDIHAVDSISFSVAGGQVLGLLGPNGAGKTTTMRMLTTYIAPTSGTALVGGFDIIKESAKVRESIGYLPESPPLYDEMSVREYLTFVAKIKGVPRQSVKVFVGEVIDKCMLQDVAGRLCSQISKGFRQRAGLAAALVHKPPVLILDEPTSGLDPAQIIEIRRLIRDLGKDHTVVLSTHILPEVSETCSHVIIIAEGRISVEGSLEELTKEKSLEERFLEASARDKSHTKTQESMTDEKHH